MANPLYSQINPQIDPPLGSPQWLATYLPNLGNDPAEPSNPLVAGPIGREQLHQPSLANQRGEFSPMTDTYLPFGQRPLTTNELARIQQGSLGLFSKLTQAEAGRLPESNSFNEGAAREVAQNQNPITMLAATPKSSVPLQALPRATPVDYPSTLEPYAGGQSHYALMLHAGRLAKQADMIEIAQDKARETGLEFLGAGVE